MNHPHGSPAPAPPQTEYDKQFQADLERATALSMETHAMDQYKRNKLQYSHSDHQQSSSAHRSSATPPYQPTMRSYASNATGAVATPTTSHSPAAYAPAATRRPRPESANAVPYASVGAGASSTPPIGASAAYSLQSSASTGSIVALPPPASVPSRRTSEHSQRGRSTPPDTSADLISFSQPAAPDDIAGRRTADEFDHQPQQPQRSASDAAYAQFQHMVSELHKMNAQLQQIPPAFRHNAAVAAPAGAAAATQMMRYQPPEPIALDSERLSKLYSQPYQPYPASASATIHIRQPPPPQHQHSIAFPLQSTPRSVYPPLPNGPFVYATVPAAVATAAAAAAAGSPIALPSKNVIGWDVNGRQQQQQPQRPSLVPMPTDSSCSTPVSSANSSSHTNANNSGSTPSQSGHAITRRRPSRPSLRSSTSDLIDLEHAGQEDNNRVSVLEAFDPLLMTASPDADADRADAASDGASTSYYSEYDPFDYLYNNGTQYSDPVYDAVNRMDAHSSSASVHGGGTPGAIGWNVGDDTASVYETTSLNYDVDDDVPVLQQEPPPLPPRRSAPSTASPVPQQRQQPQQHDRYNAFVASSASGAGTTRKLYTNVRVCKTFEPELLAFYDMVRRLRAEYKYTDRRTNVGHVVAAEFNNRYAEGTSIKLLVHPALECFGVDGNGGDGIERGQVEGYGAPVAFTCDISTTVEHVIMHVFCELEGQVLGTVADYNLKVRWTI